MPGNEDPRLEQIDQIYDDHGRLTEPDGQMLTLRKTDDETIYCLMPTRAYVRSRSVRYRSWCLWAMGLTVLGCATHWLIVRPETIDTYVLTVPCVTVFMALAVRIWNASMRAGITLKVGRRVRVTIATVKFTVHPMLHERLGLKLSDDGQLWEIYHIDPAQRRLRLKLSHAAFPTLPKFLDQTLGDAWEDLREVNNDSQETGGDQ
jgi:hypothetical protein